MVRAHPLLIGHGYFGELTLQIDDGPEHLLRLLLCVSQTGEEGFCLIKAGFIGPVAHLCPLLVFGGIIQDIALRIDRGDVAVGIIEICRIGDAGNDRNKRIALRIADKVGELFHTVDFLYVLNGREQGLDPRGVSGVPVQNGPVVALYQLCVVPSQRVVGEDSLCFLFDLIRNFRKRGVAAVACGKVRLQQPVMIDVKVKILAGRKLHIRSDIGLEVGIDPGAAAGGRRTGGLFGSRIAGRGGSSCFLSGCGAGRGGSSCFLSGCGAGRSRFRGLSTVCARPDQKRKGKG